tara:strand:+ start:255 stop:1415 length:1161 start_codon:yes stop_codon:yes gene_type:complete
MSTYITYPTDVTLKNLSFFKSNDKYKKIHKTSDLHEFNSLSHKDILIYLIPSSLVSSYKFEKNPKTSNQNNIANFISDIDTDIVSEVSDNEFFVFDNHGFVIDKSIYKKLNGILNSLKCKVILIPDYFINHNKDSDHITEFNDSYLFSFSDGTGSSVDSSSIDQYIDVIKESNPDFSPFLYLQKDNSIECLKDYENKNKFSLNDFANKNFLELPNLYKFNFSLRNIYSKLNFSKSELYLCLGLIAASILLPYFLIAQNNKYINIYELETFNIFKKIDKNTKRVVTPRIQIDQLINQIPSSFQSQTLNESKFDNLDFMTAIGEKFISEVNINFSTNIAIITIKEIPQTQYKIIKNISDRFNISVLKEDVQISDDTISGKISIKLDDE